MLTILSVFGTRPEAIKVSPVILELQKQCSQIRSIVCVTAQHRHMLDQVLDLFDISPNYDLDLMRDRQTLSELTANILVAMEPVLRAVQPDWLLVQGDTTTAMAVSLVGFYHNIRVGHIEAGLRTYNKHAPFPEEINRRIISAIADVHFAPTELARQALLAEGVPGITIHVTGNTVVDALLAMRDIIDHNPPQLPDGLDEAISGKRLILVTSHRRESFGHGLEQICLGLQDLASHCDDISIVYPVHLNPNVRQSVHRILQHTDAVHLIDPLSYAAFIWLMTRAHLILTDSGGVQEEATTLGKPLLVMREATERPEAIAASNARLVKLDRDQIVLHARDLLIKGEQYEQIACSRNLYGDGHAASRIVELITQQQGG